MAISEDTRAIIASNLTAAHCTRVGTNAAGPSAAETQSEILEIYQMYARSLGLGVAVGSSRAAEKETAAN
jgi:hypothetical protein